MDARLSGVAPAGNALGVPFMDVEHEYIFGMYDELIRIVRFRASTKLFAEGLEPDPKAGCARVGCVIYRFRTHGNGDVECGQENSERRISAMAGVFRVI